MTSSFMIGSTVETLTALDELGVPLPDPQWEFHEYQELVTLGSGRVRGLGPRAALWVFPMLEPAQVAQLEEFLGETVYIQTPKRDDSLATFQTLFNWLDASMDGEHKPGFKGWRMGFDTQHIILDEIEGS